MDYLLHILVLIGIYSVLAVSLDLVAGQLGLLSVAQAAFYGIGAYSSAIVTAKLDGDVWLGGLIGVAIAIIISLVISIPSLRLRDDYFVVATFGFQVIFFNFVNNLEFTDGPRGIPGIPRPGFLFWRIESQVGFVVLAVSLAAIAYLVVNQISTSPFGRVLRSIRENEIFAQAMGKNILYSKVVAVAVSAGLSAMAGSLYAHYAGFVDPSSFTVTESILLISMVVIGGAGSSYGPVFGAAILVILPEALRMIGLPSAAAANLREMVYGLLLVVIVMFRPSGLFGQYRFGR